jgi:hypothetical protein
VGAGVTGCATSTGGMTAAVPGATVVGASAGCTASVAVTAADACSIAAAVGTAGIRSANAIQFSPAALATTSEINSAARWLASVRTAGAFLTLCVLIAVLNDTKTGGG